MSNIQSTQRKKDIFICDTLLPYCLQRIENASDGITAVTLQKQIATMEIFPYVSDDQLKYGALKEANIHWYFVGDQDKRNPKSTESYRILERNQMKPELFKKFRQVFGSDGCAYIHEFSDKVVIEDLVKQMSQERDYTDKWWKCAADAFALWNVESNPGSAYEVASLNVRTPYMIYDDEYCEIHYQNLLERYQIVFDIRKTAGYRKYIEGVPVKMRNDAIRFLKYLGIKSSFIQKVDWRTSSLNTEISAMFSRIGKASFPVASTNIKFYELCELAEYIFIKVLLKEDLNLAKALLMDTAVNKGIVVRNINDAYMPLNCSMFYLPDDYDLEELSENKLNMFIVKNGVYGKEELQTVATSMSTVCGVENYNFGNINVKALAFYKWAWQFTKNSALVMSVLEYFNSLHTIEVNLQEFALDIMSTAIQNEVDVILNYRMNITGNAALQYNLLLNSIYRSERNDVLFRVQDKLLKEPIDVKYRILQAVENQVSSSTAAKIEKADFWNHIYLLPASGDDYYGRYVIVQYNDVKQGYSGDIILLNYEEDPNSYIEAICNYISETYDVNLTGVTSDWKSEYYRLVHGVDDFICDHRKAMLSSKDEIMFNESEMADVESLEHEYSIWERFNREKTAILRNRISDVDLESWRGFLNSKYHGRCQLCGNRTASGPQNAHFWTYRINKESENHLANLHSNIFCLCPACHGELSHGYLGKDLTQIKERALEYLEQLEDCLKEDLDELDSMDSIISSFADIENEYPGFHAPIICNVIVNGTEREMAFSWEHFMQIAFLLSGIKDGID